MSICEYVCACVSMCECIRVCVSMCECVSVCKHVQACVSMYGSHTHPGVAPMDVARNQRNFAKI